jgi:D-methionine transport system ATP-binding protein
VLITHEMEAIRAVAQQVVVMEAGRIVERGSLYDVFSAPSTPAAARFVRSVLHDRPTGSTLDRLRRAHPGRLVTVRVADRPGFTATVSTAFTAREVRNELVFGGIGELGDRSVGALTYSLGGGDQAIDDALRELRDAGIAVEEEH